MQEFRAADWSFDPFAKQCERCDAVIGRYAIMLDEQGWRHIMFWPHREWDGIEGSRRCRLHSRNVSQERWIRLF